MLNLALMMVAATLALGQTQPADPGTRAREILEQGTKDKNPDVRTEAVVALSLVGAREKTLDTLDSMLADHDVRVRIAVVSTLSGFNDPRTASLLEKALNDSVPEVDFAAARALYRLRKPDGKKLLLAVATGESKGSSSFLTKEERSTLRLLHTPTKLFITTAELVVPLPGFGFGLSSAESLLLDPAFSARAAALLLLVRESDPATKAAVQEGLTDKDWSLRAAAAHLIAMHPYPQFQKDLVPLLKDRKAAVRFRAAAAYIRLEALRKEPHPRRPKRHRH
jgi:HEAT repeat protein